MIREFITVYRLYRRHNPFPRSLRMAWYIAVKGLPF